MDSIAQKEPILHSVQPPLTEGGGAGSCPPPYKLQNFRILYLKTPAPPYKTEIFQNPLDTMISIKFISILGDQSPEWQTPIMTKSLVMTKSVSKF